MLNFDDFLPNLYQKSRVFCKLGWSVIPLLGDARPAVAKAPALPTWKEFQSRMPSESELKAWFLAQKQQGIGVVLGSFSGIFVVDIDDPQRAQEFIKFFPELTNTFTVLSGNRGLPHYYFRLPSHLSVRSQHAHGVEIRSDGQYVVAPDSVMGGRHWRIENNVDLRIITQSDLNRLTAFLRLNRHEDSSKIVQTASTSILKASSSNLNTDSQLDLQSHKITANGLKRYYRSQALKIGRNNALFAATRYARDCGWSQMQVERALVQVHVLHPPIGKHDPETPPQRQRESLATIQSVYSQVPRTLLEQPLVHGATKQLPNSVREGLLGRKLDNVARVLDGLLMAGIEAGTQITASVAYAILKAYGIGRNTIYNVLKMDVAPSPQPPPDYANADTSKTERTKQCLFGRVAKSGKSMGRTEQCFVMPAIEVLCKLLDVDRTFSDKLQPDDLASPAKYREALHTALIKRAPGQYPRRWQAARLGISKDSCRRYERRAGICVQPTFVDWLLGWHNVDQIIPDEAPIGQFIQDEQGKRYPPILDVARWLLAKGRQLIYRQQDANHYSVSDVASDASVQLLPVASENRNVTTGDIVASGDISGLPVTFDKTLPVVSQPIQNFDHQATLVSQKSDNQSHRQKSNVPVEISVLMNAEKPNCAERLYCQLSRLNPQRALTRKRANELVAEYGEMLVERGMRIIKSRRDLQNPSGFLIRWLQSRVADQHKTVDVSVADAEAQHAEWLKRLQESPYASYLMNADQVVNA
ncbi:MAG: bifunctional DNA primase/polymerase [Aggregatilineales bacterium]